MQDHPDDQLPPVVRGDIHLERHQVEGVIQMFNVFSDSMAEINMIQRAAAQRVDEAMQEWWTSLDLDTRALVQQLAEESRGVNPNG